MADRRAEIVVVVGAGPGLGQAVARRFARAGAALALVARDAQRLDALAAEVGGHGFPADVGDEGALRSAFAAVRDRLGDPTVLVYNPSVWVPGAVTETSYDALLAGLRVGAAGLLVAAQEAAPAMRRARRGTVLVTGSASALSGSRQSAGLAAQKAALRSLALSLALELEPDGIHVTTVTIHGTLAAGTEFDPERIAEHFWRLHTQPRDVWQAEVAYPG